jgi:hypothetical protein
MFEQFFGIHPIEKPYWEPTPPTAAEEFEAEQQNSRQQKALDAEDKRSRETLDAAERRQQENLASDERQQSARLGQQNDQWRQDSISKLTDIMSSMYANDSETADKLMPMLAGVAGGLGVEITNGDQSQGPASQVPAPATSQRQAPMRLGLYGAPLPMSMLPPPEPEEPPAQAPPTPTPPVPQPSNTSTRELPRVPGENLSAYLQRWASSQGYNPKTKTFGEDQEEIPGEPTEVKGRAPMETITTPPKPEDLAALQVAEKAAGLPPRPTTPVGKVWTFRDKHTGRTWNFDPSGLTELQRGSAQRYVDQAVGAANKEEEPVARAATAGSRTLAEAGKGVAIYEKEADRMAAEKRAKEIAKRPPAGGASADRLDFVAGQEAIQRATGLREYKKDLDQLKSLEQGKSLLKESPGGFEVNAVQRALAMGMNTGALTDKDVDSVVKNRDIIERAMDWINGGAVGNLSPETIKKLADLVGKKYDEKQRELKNSYGSAKKVLGRMSREEMKQGAQGEIESEFAEMPFYGQDDEEPAMKKSTGKPAAMSPEEARKHLMERMGAGGP